MDGWPCPLSRCLQSLLNHLEWLPRQMWLYLLQFLELFHRPPGMDQGIETFGMSSDVLVIHVTQECSHHLAWYEVRVTKTWLPVHVASINDLVGQQSVHDSSVLPFPHLGSVVIQLLQVQVIQLNRLDFPRECRDSIIIAIVECLLLMNRVTPWLHLTCQMIAWQ